MFSVVVKVMYLFTFSTNIYNIVNKILKLCYFFFSSPRSPPECWLVLVRYILCPLYETRWRKIRHRVLVIKYRFCDSNFSEHVKIASFLLSFMFDSISTGPWELSQASFIFNTHLAISTFTPQSHVKFHAKVVRTAVYYLYAVL